MRLPDVDEAGQEVRGEGCQSGERRAGLRAPRAESGTGPSPFALLGLLLGAAGADVTDYEARGLGLVATFEVDGDPYRVQLDPLPERRMR